MLIKHQRKPNRLKGFDYSSDNYYYVTICTKDRKECFGNIKKGEIFLNKYGKIITQQWQWLKKQYTFVDLDEFIIMPNHLHGILIIDTNVGTGRDQKLVGTGRDQKLVGTGRDQKLVGTGRDLSLQYKIKPLFELIGAFKTTSSKLIHENGLAEFAWQRSFYDHIIRNEKSLERIRNYIINNPINWEFDRNKEDDIKLFL